MEFTSSISVPMVTYKSKLRHILAQQWAIVFKMYWNHFTYMKALVVNLEMDNSLK